MKRFAILAAFSMLAGCANLVPEKVYIPIARPCVPKEVGPKPTNLETKESLRAEPDPAKRMTRIAADWARRAARMEVTEPVLEACGAPPQTSAAPAR